MDEVAVGAIASTLEDLKTLDHRREYIIQTIEAAGKMTDALRSRLEEVDDLTTLEDIFLPYKPRRRTRAQIAREAGLEPLAKKIIQGRITDPAAMPGLILPRASTLSTRLSAVHRILWLSG